MREAQASVMHDTTIQEARLIVGGNWARRPDNAQGREAEDSARGVPQIFGAVCTDSRKLVPGDLFVALKGERYDGAEFLAQAEQAGARAIITEGIPSGFEPRVPVILVASGLEALGRLARAHRERQKACVVGITGSNGKTTTRELAGAVLRQQFEVLQNTANENNRVGVPQTLLRLNDRHDFAIIEMGTSERGEIAALAGICTPQCAILTSIGASHLAGLGDLEGVMHEKSALLAALPRDGIAIVNYDDAWCVRAGESANCRVVSYGTDARCEIRAGDLRANRHGTHFTLNCKHEFRLPLHGLHNVSNALAAIALGWVSGVDVPAMILALRRVEPVPGRLHFAEFGGVGVLDDSYNANPASTLAALRTLADFPCTGQRIAVLGDMLELGRHSALLHAELGRQAAVLDLDLVIAVGPEMNAAAEVLEAAMLRCGRGTVWRLPDSSAAAEAAAMEAREGDIVLVKGSHGMHMERVVQELRARNGALQPGLVLRATVRERPVGDPLPDTLDARPAVA